MGKSFKHFFTILTAIVCTTIFFVISFAEEDGFDPEYYAKKYPDVVAVCGTDPGALAAHYANYGIKEGRYKNAAEDPLFKKEEKPVYQTYVDGSIEEQTVKYYENGVLVIQSPCVTGNVSLRRSTPKGTFTIKTHTNGKYLTGPTWRCWVDYWMRFTDSACGLHDAMWRDDSEFGGETYKTNGSHGCVNLPHEFAKTLFEKVGIGTIVYVH